MAKKWKADLIFTPAPEGYLGEQVVPQAVMVHDLRPLIHPERSMQSIYFKYWVPSLLRQSKHIFANSSFTASEIHLATGVPESKISITPLGYDSRHFHPSALFKRLHSRPYLLHIGQAYPHKNLYRLIKAFNAIAKYFPDVDLLLLGKPHPSETMILHQLVSELGLVQRVIFKSYVPYNDLPNWYRGARAFVYPSLWEGFGLPILEAMACGCPVITSFGSATEEVSGDCAYLIHAQSLDSIVDAMSEVLNSSLLAESMRRAGVRQVKKYSWNLTCQITSDAIKELLR